MENNLQQKTYIVYLTINKVNNKIYVGVHGTINPNIFDGYIGNGININSPKTYQKGKNALHAAVRKYGVNAFYRITLKEFKTKQQALDLEAEIVDETFIKSPNTYNMTLGGGMPPILSKTIYQFDKCGVLVKEWESQTEINAYYNISKDVIRDCINKKRDFKNFYWSFESTINVNEYKDSLKPYAIYQYNTQGLLLAVFKNAKEAAQKLDLNKQSIIGAVCEKSKLNECFFLKESDDIEDVLNVRNSKSNLSQRPVYRYKVSGEFDAEFKSQTDACKKCSLRIGTLSRAIKNNRIYKGYKWSYIKDKNWVSFEEIKPIKIAQYDLNHNLIKIYNTLSECTKDFPYARKVCRHERKSTQGFIFEYVS